MRSALAALCALGLLSAAGLAQAQVHKCVDASGKTVYSQSPCPSGAKSKVIQRDAPAPAAQAPAGSAKDGKAPPKPTPEAEFRKRQMEQDERDKKAAEELALAKDKQEQCQRARSNLSQLETGGRVARFNDKGEREYLEDAQIEQEKGRARSLVQKWCS